MYNKKLPVIKEKSSYLMITHHTGKAVLNKINHSLRSKAKRTDGHRSGVKIIFPVNINKFSKHNLNGIHSHL